MHSHEAVSLHHWPTLPPIKSIAVWQPGREGFPQPAPISQVIPMHFIKPAKWLNFGSMSRPTLRVIYLVLEIDSTKDNFNGWVTYQVCSSSPCSLQALFEKLSHHMCFFNRKLVFSTGSQYIETFSQWFTKLYIVYISENV